MARTFPRGAPSLAALVLALGALWLALAWTPLAKAAPDGAPAAPADATPASDDEEQDERASGEPVAHGAPARGYVGIRLLGIRALDVAAGTFEADFHLWIRLRQRPNAPTVTPEAVAVVNGSGTPALVGEPHSDARGYRRWMWRVTGTFRADFDLASFPFDRHTLEIVIAVPDRPASALMLEPDIDGSGVAQGLVIPGWTYEKKFAAHSAVVPLGPRFGDDSGERAEVHFKVFIERPVMSLLMKILVPILVCLAMSHAAFFVAPAEFATRVALITTAIFAAIGVHYALAEMLPSSNYMTIADVYFLLVYVFLFIELTASVCSHAAQVRSRERLVRRLDLAVRILAPLVFLGGAVSSSWSAAGDRLQGRFESQAAVTSSRPELRLGIARKPDVVGFDAEDPWDKMLRRLVLSPLVEPDAEGQPRAALADSVPSYQDGSLTVGEDASGLTTIARWRVREGARWGDGTPVTPEDILRPTTASARASFRGAMEVRPVKGAPDSWEVVYKGVRPHVIFNALLFPHARLRGLSDADVTRILDKDLPALSGPFMLDKVEEEGRLLRFVRNPQHRPLAALERITVRAYPTRAALHDAFKKGEVDLIPPGDVSVEEALALQEAVDGSQALTADAPYVFHLDCNLDDPVLKDRRVRRALLLAIDRQKIVGDVLGGHARIAHSWLQPGHPLFYPQIKRTYHDLSRAAALLDEAGFRVVDGKRRAPDGTPLAFTITRREDHPRAVLEQVAYDWGKLGIEVRHDPVKDTDFKHVLELGDFPQLLFWGYINAPYELGIALWTKDEIPRLDPDPSRWKKGHNTCRWRNPRVEQIYDDVRQTVNSEDLGDLLARQQKLYAEDLPSLPLYVGQQAALCGPGLEGVRLHIQGESMLAWNASEWRFAAKRQLDTAVRPVAGGGMGGK